MEAGIGGGSGQLESSEGWTKRWCRPVGRRGERPAGVEDRQGSKPGPSFAPSSGFTRADQYSSISELGWTARIAPSRLILAGGPDRDERERDQAVGGIEAVGGWGVEPA